MGRKMLTCKINEIFGCYKVLSNPIIEGEHSFVHVECIKCGKQNYLALSEIKNRIKQNCKFCKGQSYVKYTIPELNSIIGNWKVIDQKIVKIKDFRCVLCECVKCAHQQYIR